MKWICTLALAGLTLAMTIPTQRRVSKEEIVTNDAKPETGLTIKLSSGSDHKDALQKVDVRTESMSQSEREALLNRLPDFEEIDQKPFALRPKSDPPPKTGDIVKQAFPPDVDLGPSQQLKTPALRVLRHTPDGMQEAINRISIVFSQAMVPLTSLEQAVKTVPATLSPQPPGNWRWLDPKTLIFESTNRFPKATSYRVHVRKGVKSELGGSLEEDYSFQVDTPPPMLVNYSPRSGGQPLRPYIWMVFNQAIPPLDVFGKTIVSVGNDPQKMNLVSESQWSELPGLMHMEHRDRILVMQPQNDLPKGALIQVRVKAGVASMEGLLKSTTDFAFSFQTYGPFKIMEARCGWGNQCSPGQIWSVQMSNPIEAVAEEFKLDVQPELEGQKVWSSGNYLYIQGLSKGRTEYRVTLPSNLKDVYGQSISGDRSFNIQVGEGPLFLRGPGKPFFTLDPHGKAGFPVFSNNFAELRVRMYRVGPEHFDDYLAALRKRAQNRKEWVFEPVGTLLRDQKIKTNLKAEEPGQTFIDLEKQMPGNKGQVLVWIEGLEPWSISDLWRNRQPQDVICWVQGTKLALDLFRDGQDMYAWVTELATGEPVQNAKVQIVDAAVNQSTDEYGMVSFPVPPITSELGVAFAKTQNDLVILPEHTSYYSRGTSWNKTMPGQQLLWYVFDDRHLYQPGEEVSLKGITRLHWSGKETRLSMPKISQIEYVVRGSQGNEWHKGIVDVDANGSFHLQFKLPPEANLGTANIQFQAKKGDFYNDRFTWYFKVEEFRRPEFEVRLDSSHTSLWIGDSANLTATAAYFAGGSLPNADTNWNIQQTPTSFSPPHWPEFTFGFWVPWWEHLNPEYQPPLTHRSKTGFDGTDSIELAFESVWPPRPTSVTVNATIQDVNRQAWSASQHLLVHPSRHYVGLKSQRYFAEKGEAFALELIVADVDGKVQKDRPVSIIATIKDWRFEKGQWQEKEVHRETLEIHSGSKPVPFSVTCPEGGTLHIQAEIRDEQDRPNQTRLRRWVSGGQMPRNQNIEQQSVTLIPDRDEFVVGQEASILVQAPFAPAQGLLTISHNGIVQQTPFELKTQSQAVTFQIKEGWEPNVNVQVDLVGEVPRVGANGLPDPNLPTRPAYGRGNLSLQVPVTHKKLTVQAASVKSEMAPGAKGSLQVEVNGSNGKPVRDAICSVVMVDEAILALAGPSWGDILRAFYPQSYPQKWDLYARAHVLLADPDFLEDLRQQAEAQKLEGRAMRKAMPAAPMADGEMADMMVAEAVAEAEPLEEDADAAEPMAMRKNFNPLALFLPLAKTDDKGKVEIPFELPDNLTRYRIFVVATHGVDKFGQAENNLTARLPLMVRPSAPRFLNFGDQAEFPVVLQNQTSDDLSVALAIRGQNLTFPGRSGYYVHVPANDRVEVRFASQPDSAGKAEFQIAAQANWEGQTIEDAAFGSFPVWTPATTEAFALYGTLDEGAVGQPIQKPGDVVDEFGGLSVTTSSTALSELTDAFIYLYNYPYACAEQLASRLMSSLALKDILAAFEAEGLPSKEELERQIRGEIQLLTDIQNGDGGFGFWRRGEKSWPYLSIHVAHAWIRAQQKGYDIPSASMRKALGYLKDIRRHAGDYPESHKDFLESYALYVRAMAKVNVESEALKLVNKKALDQFGLDAIGFLMMALQDGGRPEITSTVRQNMLRFVENKVQETAGKAHFTTHYDDGAYLLLYSNKRTDAILCSALIGEERNHDLIPKVVKGLMAERRRGRWANTQENVFALLTLDRYFRTYESVTPDFALKMWLGDRSAGQVEFRGRSTDKNLLQIPMSEISTEKETLVLAKDGPGRLYYRLAMDYAPKDLNLQPVSYGFGVSRVYESLDEPSDVTRLKDGSWRIKAGARVRVVVSMTVPERRTHVALVDPLPAGLEIINPTLQPEPVQPKKAAKGHWSWVWFRHQNMRTERAEAFSDQVYPGYYEYTYVARATTPGHFVVPPAKAEEMYAPETFGRGATHRVHIYSE